MTRPWGRYMRENLSKPEERLMSALMYARHHGELECSGFRLAQLVKEIYGGWLLMGHGTLYRALSGLQADGYIVARWETPVEIEGAGRPPRCLYSVVEQVWQAVIRLREEREAE